MDLHPSPSTALRPATRCDIVALMDWIPDAKSCAAWGGPRFRYPFSERTFVEDSRWPALPSLVLTGAAGERLGFGQYYLRENRCHLACLIVDPRQRRRGYAGRLIEALIATGTKALGVREASLFVLSGNEPAVRCYRGLDFVPAEYPGIMPDLEDCEYMVRAGRS